MSRLEELVYLSIGRASMCWSEIPRGKPNDEYARQIADELLQAIKESEQKAVEDERAAWRLHPAIIRNARNNEISTGVEDTWASGSGKVESMYGRLKREE